MEDEMTRPSAGLFRWLAVALLAGFIAAAAIYWRPLLRVFRNAEVRRFTERAAVAIDHSDWARARGALAAGISVDPFYPDVLRQCARYSSACGLADALSYWSMLDSAGASTRDDLYCYAQTALAMGRADAAAKVLSKLKSMGIRSPEAWLLLVEYDERRGDGEMALANARSAVAAHPAEERLLLALNRLLFLSPRSAERRGEGRQGLWRVAAGGGDAGLAAITLLADSPETSRTDKELLSNLLASSLRKSWAEGLEAASIQSDLHPERFAEIAEEQARQVRPSTPALDRAQTAAWLEAHGDAGRALELLPAQASRTNFLLFEHRLQCLAALQRWADVRQELDPEVSGPSPVDPALRHAYLGLTAAQLGHTNDAIGEFGDAAAACQRDYRRSLIVAELAGKARLPLAAARAWEQILEIPSLASRAATEMLNYLKQADDLPSTAHAMDRLLQFEPSNFSLRRDLALTEVLLERRLAENRDVLEDLVAKSPGDAPAVHALALAESKLGENAKARAWLDRLPAYYEDSPVLRAIRTVVVGHNLELTQARELAAGIPVQSLRAAEKALIADWVAPLQGK